VFTKRHRRSKHGSKQPQAIAKKPRPKRWLAKRAHAGEDTSQVRLQKVLAAAGIGSRRQCEELIRQGRVEVDGKTISELGTRVDPQQQKIRVDGELVHRPKHKLYYLINKPAGVLSTSHDPAGRPRVIDLAPTYERLFTVGRLDKSSSGLILVTNDGVLTDLLTHPRYGVEKTYVALVVGVPSPEALAKLQRGVHLAEGYAHAKRVQVRREHRHSTLLEIVLDEGRNREVRRLLARIGHKVLSLRRIAMGPVRLGNLQPGESRPLRKDEIEALYQAAQEGRRASGKGEPRRTKNDSSVSPVSPQPAERLKKRSTVEPIIDKSLPADEAEADDFLLDETGDENSGQELTESTQSLDLDEGEEFDGPARDKPFSEIETTPIDFSPLGSNRAQRNKQRTVIGGDSRQSSRRHGRGKQRGSKGRKRRKQ
jgi:23S rRNA pseudouridine2605 synthase